MSVEDAVDNAFRNCTRALTYTPTKAESNEIKLFILDGTRYTNVQDYVRKGMQLPVSEYEIRQRFGALITIPPQELGEVQRILAQVHDHCSYFQWNTMSKFATVTDKIIRFCEDMAKYVGGEGLLKDQIEILSDESNSGSSFRIRRACLLAQNILGRMADAAELQESFCDALVNEVTLFQGQTGADIIAIRRADAIIEKYVPKLPSSPEFSGIWQVILQMLYDLFGGGLDKMVDDLMVHMTDAVEALNAMKSTFARLASDFQSLRDYFGSISRGVEDDDPIVRSLVSVDLDLAVSRWYEVRTLAQKFLVTISTGRST